MAEEKVGFFKRLVNGLTKTRDSIVAGIDSFSAAIPTLMTISMRRSRRFAMGDIGINTTTKIIDHLKERVAEEHITDSVEWAEASDREHQKTDGCRRHGL